MRIDSSGNVLVGATSITGLTPSSSSKTLVLNSTDANLSGAISYVSNGTAKAYHYVDSDGLFAHQVVSNNGQKFYTNNTERLRIDSSGNVGIGTPSQADTNNFGRSLDIRSSTGAAAYFRDSDDASKYAVTGFFGADSNAYLGSWGASTGAVIYTSGTERLRIDSSGNLLVGNTTRSEKFSVVNSGSVNTVGAFISNVSSDVGQRAVLIQKYDNTNTTSQIFVQFGINQGNTNSGQINANGASQAAFGSFSDIRLKENIENLPSQIDKICSLRPVEFDYKDGSGHQIGFIAQEINLVYPDTVNEGSDGMLTVTGWSKTEARLVRAIQELKTENDSLKARVAALEAA